MADDSTATLRYEMTLREDGGGEEKVHKVELDDVKAVKHPLKGRTERTEHDPVVVCPSRSRGGREDGCGETERKEIRSLYSD